MTSQQPSVGRTVHYVAHGTPIREDGTQAFPTACRAAIITAVNGPAGEAGGGIVDLAVLNPTGMFFNQDVCHVNADARLGGSWHWPEIVADS